MVSTQDYWNWLNKTFVGNLRAQWWYSGDPPQHLTGFLNDKSTRLLGWATMRQLRVQSGWCISLIDGRTRVKCLHFRIV